MKKYHFNIRRKLFQMGSAFCFVVSLAAGGAHAQTTVPLTGTGTVTAPLPPLSLLLSYSTTPAIGTFGDWTVSATGSTSIGLVVSLGSSQAQVAVNEGTVGFNIVNRGLDNLLGASLPMTWTASTTIADSVNWAPPESGKFTYNFDLSLNNSVLAGNVDLLSGVSLTITDGNNNELFKATSFPDILGLTDLLPSHDNVSVEFAYDPANGPLTVTWSSNSVLTLSLLQGLGDGTQTMFNIANSQINVAPVPEPSGVAMAGLAALGMLSVRRRRPAAA